MIIKLVSPVGPVQPIPPHCPYCDCFGPLEGAAVGAVVAGVVEEGCEVPEVLLGPDAMQEPVPRAVAQSMGAPEAKRWRRAWTSNAAGLGLPLESKRVPA